MNPLCTGNVSNHNVSSYSFTQETTPSGMYSHTLIFHPGALSRTGQRSAIQ